MRGLVCGLVMAAGLVVAPSAFSQSAVLIVSGGFGGPSATSRIAALQTNQQATLQTQQTDIVDLDARLTALEGAGGGGISSIVPFHAYTSTYYTCPASHTIGACWCKAGAGAITMVQTTGTLCSNTCGGGGYVFGFCKQ